MSEEERKVWQRERMKKDNHNIIEKRRRYKINDCIQELSRLLPSSYDLDLQNKKGTILQAAVDYIQRLQKDQDSLVDMTNRQLSLERSNRQLLIQIQQLESTLNEGSPQYQTTNSSITTAATSATIARSAVNGPVIEQSMSSLSSNVNNDYFLFSPTHHTTHVQHCTNDVVHCTTYDDVAQLSDVVQLSAVSTASASSQYSIERDETESRSVNEDSPYMMYKREELCATESSYNECLQHLSTDDLLALHDEQSYTATHQPTRQLGHQPTTGQLGHQATTGQLDPQPTGQLGHQRTGQLGHQPTTGQLGHEATGQLGHQTTGQLGHQTIRQLGPQVTTQHLDLDDLTSGSALMDCTFDDGLQTFGQLIDDSHDISLSHLLTFDDLQSTFEL